MLLIKTKSIRSGKCLYGIKLGMFFIYLIFNLVGLFFITREGCNVFHSALTRSGAAFTGEDSDGSPVLVS